MKFPAPDVLSAIPHRPPMLLVDQILSQAPKAIRTQRTFRPDEYFFQGHFPELPIVPGVILCEAALQSGAILVSRRLPQPSNGVLPVATRLNDVKFKQVLRPSDTIEIEVEITDELANAVFMTAKIWTGSRLAARLDFACALADLDSMQAGRKAR